MKGNKSLVVAALDVDGDNKIVVKSIRDQVGSDTFAIIMSTVNAKPIDRHFHSDH